MHNWPISPLSMNRIVTYNNLSWIADSVGNSRLRQLKSSSSCGSGSICGTHINALKNLLLLRLSKLTQFLSHDTSPHFICFSKYLVIRFKPYQNIWLIWCYCWSIFQQFVWKWKNMSNCGSKKNQGKFNIRHERIVANLLNHLLAHWNLTKADRNYQITKCHHR